MVSPAFIDPHFHLENALLYDAVNASGTLREAINIYADIKRNMSREDIVARANARPAHGGRERHVVDAQQRGHRPDRAIAAAGCHLRGARSSPA